MGFIRKKTNKMPNIKKGESSKSYMHRCVPLVKKEGRTKEQAVGKCYGMFRSKWTKKKREIQQV